MSLIFLSFLRLFLLPLQYTVSPFMLFSIIFHFPLFSSSISKSPFLSFSFFSFRKTIKCSVCNFPFICKFFVSFTFCITQVISTIIDSSSFFYLYSSTISMHFSPKFSSPVIFQYSAWNFPFIYKFFCFQHFLHYFCYSRFFLIFLYIPPPFPCVFPYYIPISTWSSILQATSFLSFISSFVSDTLCLTLVNAFSLPLSASSSYTHVCPPLSLSYT